MELVDVVLAVIAGLMALVTAFLLRWATEAATKQAQAVVLFLFVMMTSMAGGAALYLARPSPTSLVEGLALSGGLMLAAAAGVFVTVLRLGAGKATEGTGSNRPVSTWPFLVPIVMLVLGGEFLMGWAFQLASSPGSLPSGGDLTLFVSAVVNSPWFIFTMAAEMGLSTFLLRARLGWTLTTVLGVQAIIMALSPTVLPSLSFGSVAVNAGNGAIGLLSFTWPNVSIVLGSIAMIGLFIYIFEHIYRHPELPRTLGRYLVLLVGVYGVMMAGLFVWLNYGDARLFAASVIAEMVLYFSAVLLSQQADNDDDRFTWQLEANWAASLLSGIFVAEVFMGAVLDLVLDPADWTGSFPNLPLSGGPATLATNVFWNGFGFLVESVGSTWFLVMMGVEMGALVVFKLRESHNLENRIRLVLMMACYWAFAVFFTSTYYADIVTNPAYGGGGNVTNVAVLGWSMGIGSAQIAPPVLIAIALTYAITGVLCFLFGRRVICSVFCTAPLMYQGTAIDAMKTFNQHSPIGRKYLSSKLSNAYMVTTGLVMGALAVTSVLSYTNYLSWTNVTVGPFQWDPTYFLMATSFSVAWYLLLVAIPYVGNYNCVTMGWCYTGTIAQAFQKLGPYKLKVRSKEVCRACTTVDCAKACPVSLVDMPGHFRSTGEFRSTKCCGVGNCVGACPYDNLYIHDIRHVLRRWSGRSEVPPARTRLPMLRNPRPAATTAAGPIRVVPDDVQPKTPVT